MDQRVVQEGISRAVEGVERLRRWSELARTETAAGVLDELRGVLERVGHEAWTEGFQGALRDEFDRAVAALERIAPSLPGRAEELRVELHELVARSRPSLEIPSVPLFGVLPLARVVSQDVHSIADYANGVMTLVPGLVAGDARARLAGAILGASLLPLSALTDYRLSLANVVPIEVHEAMDYVWGLSAIALPFALGYWHKAPLAAAAHVTCGVATILMSLFTDYRAAKGIGHSRVASAAMMGATLQPGVSAHIAY